MALPATVYRAAIELANVDANHYEKLQFTVARHPSETAERLVARVLAYALWHEEGLAFTKGICAGDEPDLWSKEPDGRVRLWIEVGLPDPERLRKASRHAGQVVLLAYGAGRPRWEAAHLGRLAGAANIRVFALEEVFLKQVVACLERSIVWSLTVTEGSLFLTAGETSLETALICLQA
ncbi:hypothetical protein DESUT3_02880 [Desulfuromonas versatilis]|uniref:YaeQ family protein n=1 Tax=Desulfuromonas versatilis TaxID=2802975 RepID=A0ABM8HRY1_9BACT|nr:YaeQ family protein [Desulfuromonas versatilis]BCR03219.1 hypothetical protein DESUT3_02880 [Desulfuromonas versatilis]